MQKGQDYVDLMPQLTHTKQKIKIQTKSKKKKGIIRQNLAINFVGKKTPKNLLLVMSVFRSP